MADSCAGPQLDNAKLASWPQVPGADAAKHGQLVEAMSGCSMVRTAKHITRSISIPAAHIATPREEIAQQVGLSLSCRSVPSAKVEARTLSRMEKEPAQPGAPEGALKTIAKSTSPASHLKAPLDFNALSGGRSTTSFNSIAPVGLRHPSYSIQRRVSLPTDAGSAKAWLPHPSYFDSSNLSSVLTCSKLNQHVDEAAERALDMQETNRGVLTKILEIISQLKVVHENDMSELKSDFESKLCIVEKNFMESLTAQHNLLKTNVDSRLCALEEAKKECAQMKENGICGFEEDMYVLPKKREVIQQQCSDQKEEVANLKAHVEKRLRNLEDHFARVSKELQDTIFQNQCRQQEEEEEEDSTGWETILEDKVAVFPHRGIQQQEFEKTRVTKSKRIWQRRLCEVEGNISLIVSILNNMQHQQQQIPSIEKSANTPSQSTSLGLLEHNISIISSEQHPNSPFAPILPEAASHS